MLPNKKEEKKEKKTKKKRLSSYLQIVAITPHTVSEY